MAILAADQHPLLLGPPGTAKSELADRIDGARYWEILLSKFTAGRAPGDPRREARYTDKVPL